MEIKISQVIADLDNGLDRKQIREKYSLSWIDTNALFQHPQLKGRRKKSVATISIIDDVTGDTSTETIEETIEETVAETASEENSIDAGADNTAEEEVKTETGW